MEKPKTIAEARKDKFDRQTALCKELANLAMQDIDDALFEHYSSSKSNYEHVLEYAQKRGEISPEEAKTALANYEAWQAGEHEEGVPFYDDDTLAGPLGYTQDPFPMWQ